MKLVIGSIFSVGGTLCLFIAASTQGPGQKIGLFWPVTFHFVNSIAFAHLLPISLAFFAKQALHQAISKAGLTFRKGHSPKNFNPSIFIQPARQASIFLHPLRWLAHFRYCN